MAPSRRIDADPEYCQRHIALRAAKDYFEVAVDRGIPDSLKPREKERVNDGVVQKSRAAGGYPWTLFLPAAGFSFIYNDKRVTR